MFLQTYTQTHTLCDDKKTAQHTPTIIIWGQDKKWQASKTQREIDRWREWSERSREREKVSEQTSK